MAEWTETGQRKHAFEPSTDLDNPARCGVILRISRIGMEPYTTPCMLPASDPIHAVGDADAHD